MQSYKFLYFFLPQFHQSADVSNESSPTRWTHYSDLFMSYCVNKQQLVLRVCYSTAQLLCVHDCSHYDKAYRQQLSTLVNIQWWITTTTRVSIQHLETVRWAMTCNQALQFSNARPLPNETQLSTEKLASWSYDINVSCKKLKLTQTLEPHMK